LLSFVLPKVELENSSQNYSRFVIGPLESGFGITLGNALRRILLSSLPGAAVTSLRISDISHEFSVIPHVKEDTTWFLLNVKQLRFRFDEDIEDAVAARIEVRGEGPVSGGDIICPPGVEVVNPEILLLTADSDKAELDVELTIERGRGYLSIEDRASARLTLGEIPVDAIFSPVRRVRYNVERARIGHESGYDKLLLEIWTDGTIAPEDGLRQAAQLMVRHLVLIRGVEATLPEQAGGELDHIPGGLYEKEIEALGLNVRVYNCLRRAGINTVGEILESLSKGDEELLAIRNFGSKSLDEMKERLVELRLLPLGGAVEPGAEVESAAQGVVPLLDETEESAEYGADAEQADDEAESPDATEQETEEPAAADSDDEVDVSYEAPSEDEQTGGAPALNEQLAKALRRAMMGGGADDLGDMGA
jgi:DNA-directed RNA polymerase subunit alpha